MSDAALTIWISCGSLLISAASLVVSIAAYRRSDMLRRLDRLSELSRDIANLRPRLEQLERTIPKAVQSGAPASAAPGHGLRAGADAAAVRAPRGQLDGGTIPRTAQSGAPASATPGHGLRAGADAAAVRAPRELEGAASIPKRVDYAGIETKSVTARQVSTRLEQLVHYMRERAGRSR